MLRRIAVLLCLLLPLTAQTEKVIIFENGDVIHGQTKDADDGKSVRIKTDNFGVITAQKDRIKRIVEEAKREPGAAAVDDRKPTGKKLPDEDRLMSRLFDFVPGSMKHADISGVKTIAVKRVSVTGAFDINDKVFEARLITLIARAGYTVVERQALAILLKEQELSASGATADESKIGKLLGVDAFLTVELTAPREGRLEASIKLTTVEGSTVAWEDDLSGEYYSPLRIWVSAVYGLPTGVTLDYFGDTSGNTILPATSGHLLGGALGIGMQMPGWFSSVEIGFTFQVQGDFLGATPGTTAVPQGTNIIHYSLQSTTLSSVYPLFVKVHPAEWFNSPLDIVRIYGGVGLKSFGLVFKSEWGSLNVGGAGMAILAGIEFAPIRDITVFAEYSYILDAKAAGLYVTQTILPTRSLFNFGLTYFFVK